MANEGVKIEEGDNSIRRTCQSSVAITKGTLLKLVDPNTVSGANIGSGDAFGGIAVADKDSADTATDIAVDMSGVYDLTVNSSVAVTMGAAVVMSGANLIRNAVEADTVTGAIVGYAEEAGATGEVIRVRLRGL